MQVKSLSDRLAYYMSDLPEKWVFRQPDRSFLQKRVIKTGITRPSKCVTRFSLPVFVFLTLLFLPVCLVHRHRPLYSLGQSRSTKRLILVISGCQYKDYAPCQSRQPKEPLYDNKKPLLCNTPMLLLRFLPGQ